MKHIVEYRFSECGWGGYVSYDGFDTIEEAKEEINNINSKNTSKAVPNTYTVASYCGVKDVVPKGYDY